MKAGISSLISLSPKGPLNGYLVLEIGNLISGPKGSEELARKGATVIKVERKETGGDTARKILSKEVFTSCNAAKASIAFDFHNHEDNAHYQQLLQMADVIIDNRSPLAKARDMALQTFLKSDKAHPVIFCSIVGYDSQDYADRSALDVAVQAETGMAMVNSPNPQLPLKVGFVVIDATTALQCASTIKDHLLGLARGMVEISLEDKNVIYVEQSMTKVSAHLLTGQYLNALTQQKEPLREDNRDLWIAPFSFYKTQDGMVSIAIVGDKLFKDFCEAVLKHPVLAEQYPTNQSRLNNQDFEKALADIISQKTSNEWITACSAHGIVCTKVNSVLEMLKEPFAKKMLTQTSDGVTIIANTATSSVFPEETLQGAPGLDAHRDEILALLDQSRQSPPVLFRDIYNKCHRSCQPQPSNPPEEALRARL